MEPLLETIQLDIEESSELLFKVNVEGAASSPAKVRLVCEGKDIGFIFEGHPTEEPGVVQFIIPEMIKKMDEGQVTARVEVLIENRYFVPVQFGIEFKKTMKVFAEAINLPQVKKSTGISVSISPIIVSSVPSNTQTKSIPVVVKPKPLVIETPQKKSSEVIKPKTTLKQQKQPKLRSGKTLKERYVLKDQSQPDDIIEKVARQLAKKLVSKK